MPVRPTIIERAIEVARKQAAPLLVPVTHIPVIGRDASGPVYGSPVELEGDEGALVELVSEDVSTPQGITPITRTKLTFFYGLVVTGRDKFIVDDSGSEWMVGRFNALLKPDRTPYMVEVWLGDRQATA